MYSLWLLIAACSFGKREDGGGVETGDPTTDSGADSGGDSGSDSGADSGSDSGSDSGADSGGDTAPPGPEDCADGEDNDRDGATDCVDDDCACLAECLAAQEEGGFNLLTTGGFESDSAPVAASVPDTAGIWQGDLTQLVAASDDDAIVPREGSRMLQFLKSGPETGAVGRGGAQVWQIVDVTAYAGRSLCIGGWYARVTGDAGTDTQFRVSAWTWAGAPADLPTVWAGLEATDCDASPGCTVEIGNVTTPDTWTPLASRVDIPADADPVSIVVMISANEDVVDGPDGDEFDGHFADDIWLWLP